ncbi:MAG TPA: hypothetical protein VHQ47_09780 [Phycisphaerae bacterium]|jgi:hypothetical protein|nr:hypothetical protein [Phycisphaerae bacterium]
MSLVESKAALTQATKELFARWRDVQNVWSDAQSQEFEKVYLLQLEQDVRSAVQALDHMDQVLNRIENDCE